jgi:AP-3 complex subunit sigma
VCELDLIFNPEKLNYIIDEIIVDGMVCETNISEITGALKE